MLTLLPYMFCWSLGVYEIKMMLFIFFRLQMFYKVCKSYLIFKILLMLMECRILLIRNTVEMAGGDINTWWRPWNWIFPIRWVQWRPWRAAWARAFESLCKTWSFQARYTWAAPSETWRSLIEDRFRTRSKGKRKKAAIIIQCFPTWAEIRQALGATFFLLWDGIILFLMELD